MSAPGRRRYPGVRSFEEADAAQFFGRPRAADELLLRVLSVGLLLQFAPSGVGKTSLLQAGLFPRLRPHGYFPFTVRLNRSDETLTAAIRRAMAEAAAAFGLPEPVIPEAAPDAAALLAGTQLWSTDVSLLTPVLVFDQFEEVYTLRDEAFRRGFAQDIGRLIGAGPTARHPGAEQPVPVKVIISLREEFLGRLEELAAEIPDLFHERLRLAPLGAEEARDAIVRPAALDGEGWASPAFGFAPGCVDELLDFIDGASDRVRLIEPLTLQLVCSRAEALAMARPAGADGRPLLAIADFGGLDGLKKLVAEHFDHELGKLADAGTRRRAREMFEQSLLDPGGKRLMLEEGEIQRDHRLDRAALDCLVEGRLLRREPRNESLFYEISHDRMAEAIARQRKPQLPRWVKRSLATAAVVIVGLLAGGIYVADLQHETQASLEESQRLYGLLLGNDLVERLREAGGNDALGAVIERIETAAAVPGVSPEVSKLRLLGDLATQRHTLADARQHYQEALDWLPPAADGAGAARAVLAERARLLGRLGAVEADAGRLGLARRHLEMATQVWGQVLAAQPLLEDRIDAAELNGQLAALLTRQDQLPAAEAQARVAVEAARSAWVEAHVPAEQGAQDPGFARGRAMRVLAEALLILADIWESGPQYQAAELLARESRRLRPFSAQAILQTANASAALGLRQSMDQPTPQLPDGLKRAARQLDQLTRSDPDDRRLRYRQTQVQLAVALQVVSCLKDARCARTMSADTRRQASLDASEAAATLKWLTSLDPENQSWRHALARAHDLQARILLALGEHAAALALQDSALGLLRANREPEIEPANVDLAAVVLLRRFEPLTRLERQAEAESTLADARRELAALPGPARPRWSEVYLLTQQSRLLAAHGRKTEAAVAERQAAALSAALAEPWNAALGRSLAASEEAWNHLGASWDQGDAASFEASRKAAPLFLAALRDDPFNANHWLNLNFTDARAAQHLETAVGSTDVTEAATAQALRMRAAALAHAQVAFVLSADPATKAGARRALQDARLDLSRHLMDHGREAEAGALAHDVASQARELAASGRASTDELVELADAFFSLGHLRAVTATEGWEEPMRMGMGYAERLIAAEPQVANHRAWWGWMHAALGEQLVASGRNADASVAFEAAAKACRLALTLNPEDYARKNAESCLADLPQTAR